MQGVLQVTLPLPPENTRSLYRAVTHLAALKWRLASVLEQQLARRPRRAVYVNEHVGIGVGAGQVAGEGDDLVQPAVECGVEQRRGDLDAQAWLRVQGGGGVRKAVSLSRGVEQRRRDLDAQAWLRVHWRDGVREQVEGYGMAAHEADGSWMAGRKAANLVPPAQYAVAIQLQCRQKYVLPLSPSPPHHTRTAMIQSPGDRRKFASPLGAILMTLPMPTLPHTYRHDPVAVQEEVRLLTGRNDDDPVEVPVGLCAAAITLNADCAQHA